MAKIFDRKIVYGRRINENDWFKLYQPILLWILNHHPEGRDFFCFTNDEKLNQLPYVSEIAKNYVRYSRLDGKKIRHKTVFCVGAKFANIVRFKWPKFQQLVADYFEHRQMTQQIFAANHPLRQFEFEYQFIGQRRYTTSTFYPDPNPETSTDDGFVGNTNDDTWANVIGAASGTSWNNSVTDNVMCRYRDSTSAGLFKQVYRSRFGFDLTSLGTDSIDSATLSIVGTTKASQKTVTLNANIYSHTPDNPTSIGAGDYDNFGSTAFSSNIAIGSWNTSGYNDFALNSSGLAYLSAGVVFLGMRDSTSDVAGSSPGYDSGNAIENINGVYAETTGTTTDPKLVVDHTASSTPSNDERDAEIHGQLSTNASRAAEISGSDSSNASRSAEIHGTDTATAARSAELTGSLSDSDSRSAEMTGSDASSNARSAEIYGITDSNNARSAEVTGSLSNSDSRASEITGANTSNDSRSAEIYGEALDTNTRGAEIHGELDTSDSRDAEITGVLGSNDARSAEVYGTSNSQNSRSAEIQGALSSNDSRSSEVWGEATSTNLRASEITGQSSANDSRSAEIEGIDGSNSSRGAEVHGTESSNDARASEITGQDTSSNSRSAEIHGQSSSTDNRSAELTGKQFDNSSRGSEVSGTASSNNARSAEVTGADSSSDSRSAEVYGQASAQANRAAELTGSAAASNSRGAEITGIAAGSVTVTSSRGAEITGENESPYCATPSPYTELEPYDPLTNPYENFADKC